jgi:hypothetical protein
MLTFEVSSVAVQQAYNLGLGDDAEALVALLARFARAAALVTDDRGTRRYGGYVLDVRGCRVHSIAKLDPRASVCPDCHGTQRHRMSDNGKWVEVPCQACTTEK